MLVNQRYEFALFFLRYFILYYSTVYAYLSAVWENFLYQNTVYMIVVENKMSMIQIYKLFSTHSGSMDF